MNKSKTWRLKNGYNNPPHQKHMSPAEKAYYCQWCTNKATTDGLCYAHNLAVNHTNITSKEFYER